MDRKFIACAIFFIFIISSGHLFSQKEMFFNSVELNYSPGYIMPHNKSIDYMIKDRTSAFNINLIKQTTGKKRWQQLYHNPRIGYGFYHGTLGNNNVYGKSYSLYSFFEGPCWNYQNDFMINYRLSYGVSYVSKTFDVYDNYNNIAIGSNLNIHFSLMLNAAVSLTDQLTFVSGVNFTHFSNGKVKSPNKGLNVVSASAGMRYLLYPLKYEENSDVEVPPVQDKNSFSLFWSHGVKDFNRFNKTKYYISSLTLNFEHKYKHWGRYGLGADLFYDNSIKNFIKDEENAHNLNSELFRLGVHGSHDFIVGDFALSLQLGYYIYSKVFYITNLYSRVGIKYNVYKSWQAKISLKSHNANAEFIEFGIGYKW
jgi:hypothetical protein